MGARYYQPELGRWTQPDPSGLDANAYAYVGGNPVNFIDPSGLFSAGEFARECALGALEDLATDLITSFFSGGSASLADIVGGCLVDAGLYVLDEGGREEIADVLDAVLTGKQISDILGAVAAYLRRADVVV
jgi:uncharacterized protein RhaS with RHS repeats